jgi:hypothetical protein
MILNYWLTFTEKEPKKKFKYFNSKERELIRRCVCVLLVNTKYSIIDITILTMELGGRTGAAIP